MTAVSTIYQCATMDNSREFERRENYYIQQEKGNHDCRPLKSRVMVAISGNHLRAGIALYLGIYRSNVADSWLKMTAITRLSILGDLYMMDIDVTALAV